MGIKGLSTFMRERFQGWQDVNFQKWSHLIIDGNNICYTLYRKHYNWLLGGEYDKFGQKVLEFFKDASFNHPIVVFDGTGYDERKLDTTWERRKRAMDDMQDVQGRPGWDLRGIRENAAPLPLMLISVFIDALQSLGIEICVVNGEADNVIADLANCHKCPVLASDSDFFIFKLEHGFVHFDRYYYDKMPKSLFTIGAFMREFDLKTYELCLLIPATFGNDFIKTHRSIKPDDYTSFLATLAKFGSPEEFLGVHSYTGENFKKAKEQYIPCTGETASKLPPWVLENFKCGRFTPYLLSMCDEKCFLPRVVEVIKKESAWECSKYIRQFLYGFMAEGAKLKVREMIREDCFPKLVETPTTPRLLRRNPINFRDPIFASREVNILQELVLVVLRCPEQVSVFNDLENKWKLPLAATHYWYREKKTLKDQRRDILISLLLSFLTCSGIIPYDVPPLPPVNPRTRSAHLTALHAFAQWQCVYFDARALNYLAREPFPTTSPAFLYSGEVAMHYATIISHQEDWLAGVVERDSDQWKLINTFLHFVTGRQEERSTTKGSTTHWTKVKTK